MMTPTLAPLLDSANLWSDSVSLHKIKMSLLLVYRVSVPWPRFHDVSVLLQCYVAYLIPPFLFQNRYR